MESARIVTWACQQPGMGGKFGGHDLFGVFGVELDALGTGADPEGMVGFEGAAGEQNRAGRQRENALSMEGLTGENWRHIGEERVGMNLRQQFNEDRADLPPTRMVAYPAAHSRGQQLVPIADSEQRNLPGNNGRQPLGKGHAPRKPIGHHGMRAGDYHPATFLRSG